MPRAEDDQEVLDHSVDFSDERVVAHDQEPAASTPVPQSRSRAEAGQPDDGLERQDPKDPKRGKRNPSHDTHKPPQERPRGAGDGELMEQPGSQSEAREPGPDDPKFDE